MRTILVTSALPYANGPIHVGHLLEYIQTDIWVRFQKLMGNICYYVCADDAHGTPIMIKAKKEGITAEQLIDTTLKEHKRDFAGFLIDFDHYHTTHSKENERISCQIYRTLCANNLIYTKIIEQYYDEDEGVFLPDRYVKGECPRCGARDQYGDNCEECGSTYNVVELGHPISILSGKTPKQHSTEHSFFKLTASQEFLRTWIKSGTLQKEIAHKVDEWFEDGLEDWCISRDAPYFGFPIPGRKDKFFYVWLDAPVGYMASFQSLCVDIGLDFSTHWNQNSATELHHFIGKDIAYFHALFWPAVLRGGGFRLPSRIHCHGFLTINGEKMSKSRGSSIKAKCYLDHLDPDYLRYYFAYKLSNGVNDIDLNITDFKDRTNSDLVGKVVNIASRCAGFLNKHFANVLLTDERVSTCQLWRNIVDTRHHIADAYEHLLFSKAMRLIMDLADQVNRFINDKKPWEIAKQQGKSHELHEVCSIGIALFARLIGYLAPVVPQLFARSQSFLNTELRNWEAHLPFNTPTHQINSFNPLMRRIDSKQLNAVFSPQEGNLTPHKPTLVSPKTAKDTQPTIPIEHFQKVDLCAGRIITAHEVEDSHKLLRLSIDIGKANPITVFAGLKSHLHPEKIIGKMVVVAANLEPRKMRFGTSHGMVLAATSHDGKHLHIITPGQEALPGEKIS